MRKHLLNLLPHNLFLKVIFSSCFWLCAPASNADQILQVPSGSMSYVLLQCYWHFNTNTFSFTDCVVISLPAIPLLPVEDNGSNILESMLSGGFPKVPGHTQPPTWILSGNSLKIWRKKSHLTIQQLSQRQVISVSRMFDSLKGRLTNGIFISFTLSNVAGKYKEVEAEGIGGKVKLFYQSGLNIQCHGSLRQTQY